MKCLSEQDIVRLADFSRDPKDPGCFPDKILVDMTIKKQANSSEIEYFLFLSKYADFSNEQLQALFNKGSLTLIVLLSRIN